MINREFWKGKKVFVTGHTGFKGSWLSLILSEMNSIVSGFALDPPTIPSLYEQARIRNLIYQDFRGDIRNLSLLKDSLNKVSPEIVIHMAAQPLVRKSYLDPVGTYATNVMGTVNLLEAVRSSESVEAVVVVTTDKCYENREWVWGYRENEALGGYDPYSSSKGAAELVTAAYRQSFFSPDRVDKQHHIAIASARAGNVIGGGDYAEDRLIPDIIKAFRNTEKVLIRNPKATRPWQHVLEPLGGYLLLAERLCGVDGLKYTGAWNFGPNDDDAKPVEDIVKRMCSLWGPDADYEIDDADHPHEAQFLKLNTSKARQILGWFPLWNIDKALEMTIKWGIEEKATHRQRTLDQINEYFG